MAENEQLKIIVMDDEPLVLTGISMLLESVGHNVSQAKEGSEVTERLRNGESFDVAILDLIVRRGAGAREIAAGLREAAPEMKMIVTSGYDGDEILTNYQDYGFDGCLPKPFTLYQLKSAIDDVFRPPSS